jgi:hypothetical protein
MKLLNVGAGVLLSLSLAYASDSVLFEDKDRVKSPAKIAQVSKEIEQYSRLLEEAQQPDVVVSESIKNNYKAFIKSYSDLLERIKVDPSIDLESEIFRINETHSIFSGGFYS